MTSRSLVAALATTAIALASPTIAIAQDESPAARSGYADINGLEMYYEVHGSGPPLVLLHGSLVTIDLNWSQVIPTLAKTHQVIAIEQQGHGHTGDIDRPLSYEQMADDTAKLLRFLEVENADIVGYSMGGTTALQLAIRHPGLVRKLVVISAQFGPDGMYPEGLAGVEHLTPELFTGSGLPEAYAAVAPDPDGWAGLVARVQQLVTGFEGWPPDAIQSIAAPTMVVIGDSDEIRPEHAVELFRLLGGGVPGDTLGQLPADRLLVLPGTAHVAVAMTLADWLVPNITPFLEAPMPEA
jgi:pimeloyl-ACP methyl ester carboxylesterase